MISIASITTAQLYMILLSVIYVI